LSSFNLFKNNIGKKILRDFPHELAK